MGSYSIDDFPSFKSENGFSKKHCVLHRDWAISITDTEDEIYLDNSFYCKPYG